MSTPADDPVIESRRRQIEQTRAELSGSLDELGQRLSPDHIKHQAMEGVRDMATTARTGLIETLKANPLPTAMLAGGIYLLVRNRRGEPAHTVSYRVGGPADSRASRSLRGAVDSAVGSGRSGVDRLQSTAGDMGSRVQGTADDVGDRLQQTAGEAQQRAQDSLDRLQEAARSNPLAAALVVAGAGALCGLLLPTTEHEQQAMGPARDQLMGQVTEKAQEVAGKVQQVAQAAGQAAADTARDKAAETDLAGTARPSGEGPPG